MSAPIVTQTPPAADFESSIFDNFDMPAPAKAPTCDSNQLLTTASLENDIFASFDSTSGISTPTTHK